MIGIIHDRYRIHLTLFPLQITELIFGGSKSLVSTMSTVGEFVKKCRVDALNLSGYDLTPEHLRKLKLSLGDTKVSKFDSR